MTRIDTSTFGGRLRYARVRAGKTQEQVAHRLRTHQTIVSDWETGEKDLPMRQLAPLTEYLGITATYLLAIKKPERAFMQGVR